MAIDMAVHSMSESDIQSEVEFMAEDPDSGIGKWWASRTGACSAWGAYERMYLNAPRVASVRRRLRRAFKLAWRRTYGGLK